MIPEKNSLFEEIKRLQERKKLRQIELDKFLEQVKLIRKEIEDIDAQLKSKWAVRNKFYKN